MRNSRRTILAASAVAAAALIAGCGSQAAPGTTITPKAAASAPAPARPANPVVIVRQAGATPAPGAVYGKTWVNGLSADGSFSKPYHDTYDYESVTVFTLNPGMTGEEAAAQIGAVSSDSQSVIIGPDWYMYVSPVNSGDRPSWPVSPRVIAARVGGTVLTP